MKHDPVSKIMTIAQKALEKSEKKEITLPKWPDGKRGVPNAFLRSALFSATKPAKDEDRENLTRAVCASQNGFTVIYTGKQLNQDDLLLWETLVDMAKATPLGVSCKFTAYSILKSMGLGDSGKERSQLKLGITRLIACAIEIEFNGTRAYTSSLITTSESDSSTDQIRVTLDRNLINLYRQHTWINLEQRVKLKKKPLAQFLFGYYSSHKHPYPIKIETLLELSGSKTKRIAKFKESLKLALEELINIEFLLNYSISDDNLITVSRCTGNEGIIYRE